MGIIFIARPNHIVGVLPTLIGMLILLDGGVRIQTAKDAKVLGYERWWMVMILGAAVSLLGLLLNIKPFESAAAMMMLVITLEYEVASNEVNTQVDEINRILKAYDPTGMLVGEAPCTKDLIEITDKDFATVNVVSILAVFAIIAFVFRSPFLPVLLISVIELAIFINLGIPYLTGTELPFIASIVIGTIQLGSTVDYAILMTGRYETERNTGKSKKEAVKAAHQASMKSIIVSAVSFFAATFGVGLYSNIDMIGSLCNLMSRGALISMVIVLCMLPAMFMVFDKVIIRTSFSFREALKNERKQKN